MTDLFGKKDVSFNWRAYMGCRKHNYEFCDLRIITEAAFDVVCDVSGGGGSTSAIVYTEKMSHDPEMTSAFCFDNLVSCCCLQ